MLLPQFKLRSISFWCLIHKILATLGFLTLSLQVKAQTVYDSLVKTEPHRWIILYSGSESERPAHDVAASIASRRNLNVSRSLDDKLAVVSYQEFNKAIKNSSKYKQYFTNKDTCVIDLDCSRDQGSLPDLVYNEVRVLGGPDPERQSSDQRFVHREQKPFIWSNLRSFVATEENIDACKLIMVLSADALEDMDQLHAKLRESISDDRPPVFPDSPLRSLRSFPLAVMPFRLGSIDPKIMSDTGPFTERITSLLSSLGMSQVDRGAGREAVLQEQRSQKDGDVTPEAGRAFGDSLGASMVAVGTIQNLEIQNHKNQILDPYFKATAELYVRLYAVKSSVPLYDSGTIVVSATAKTNHDLLADDSKPRPQGLDKDEARALSRVLKNALYVIEMGIRSKADSISQQLNEIYADQGAKINWIALHKSFVGHRFLVSIPEHIGNQSVESGVVQAGLIQTLTEAGVDVVDPAKVQGAIDQEMIVRLLNQSATPEDRARLNRELNADVVITGDVIALAKSSGSAEAQGDLKVISLHSGQILGSVTKSASETDESGDVASRRVLVKVANIASKDTVFWDSVAKNLANDGKLPPGSGEA